MDTSSFYKTYPFNEVEVISISDTKEGLSLVLDLNAYLALVGNGFRSEINETYTHEFVFKGVHLPINIQAPIQIENAEYQNNHLSFLANQKMIQLPNVEVIIHPNHKKGQD